MNYPPMTLTAKKLLFVLCLFIFALPTVEAQVFNDAGFTSETVLTLPAFSLVGATFAPDGRIFVWQREGIVRIYKNGSLLPAPFLDISSQVNIGGDRGLLGLALDPSITQNGYVYLLYVFEHAGDPNSHAPRTARLTRVTADPNNPDVVLPRSEIVLLGNIGVPPCSSYPAGSDCLAEDSDSHTIGTLLFAPDGALYVGNGDGASYSFADPLALRSQDLNSYSGKILRINSDGSAPPDNPFYDGTNSIQSRVWAYGLRNPFRFGLDPILGEPLIGDVGWSSYEELNRGRGSNFGWPCFEGSGPQPDYQSSFTQCQQLDPASVTPPLYNYFHSEGASITGGVFYTATEYPSQYQGNYFFADYAFSWIRRVIFDGDQNIVDVQEFATNAGFPVDLKLGPDGFLYYVSLEFGELRRIRFNGPFANAAANPAAGYSPLNVTFSSTGSFDPSGQMLTYFWDFGDGASSSLPNPTHLYTSGSVQTFTATLTVTNEDLDSSSDFVLITIGTLPPAATISNPSDGTTIVPDEVVNFSGSATDPDDGALPPASIQWTVLLHHESHVHTFLEQSGFSGSFVAQSYGPGDYSYEIILTATDTSGLTHTTSVNLPLDQSGPCSFCDDFEDSVLSQSWTYKKGIWTESGGYLQGTATRKASAVASPIFQGCTNCAVEADLQTTGDPGNRVWLFGWYVDKNNRLELLMKEEQNVWVLKQRFGGSIVTKMKAQAPIDPNTDYKANITFDGTTFTVLINDTAIITMPKAAGTSPSGTVGFQAKATTARFGLIDVQ